mgnify:CR=1 FL=1
MRLNEQFMKKNLFLFLFFLSFCFWIRGQESYYNDVNLNVTGLTLKEELATKIIATHSQFLFYEQIWEASKITDLNPENNQEVLLIYGYENGDDSDLTNDKTREINNNGGSSGQWNREHVYSQSLGTPPLSDIGPGSDAHHLRPADAQTNSARNNRKFTNGSGNSGIQNNGGWYPGDEWKGDVARMMMYMYLRYPNRCLITNIGIGSNSNTPDDMIDLFLEWNAEDPVSDFERQRNTYHENTINENAQGNRNPFIDNPILATRIWEGPRAEDTWGIFTNNDTEAPTPPTNLTVLDVSTFSVELTWSASTDNVAVTSYDVYVNNVLQKATSNTSIALDTFIPNTNYSIKIIAKDIANNKSEFSESLFFTTLNDIEAPSIPDAILVSNETESSFVINWTASSDNTSVAYYKVYIEDILQIETTTLSYTASNLEKDSSYKIQLAAVDIVGNTSNLSSPILGTTTNGMNTASELFFSEYLEGESNNKALEIVNLTGDDINLGNYSIARQSNGGLNGDDWESFMPLKGIIFSNDVYVIVNEAAAEHSSSKSQAAREAGEYLIQVADSIRVHDGDTNFGAPINFNGNDPVGLFKNGTLIDIIGIYNGGSSNFAKDKTLRRKSNIFQPNTNFDLNNEWEVFDKNDASNFGIHNTSSLAIINSYSNNAISFYPNPTKEKLFIKSQHKKLISLSIFNTLGGKLISLFKVKNTINVSTLPKGVYIIKYKVNQKWFTSKFIKS